MQTYGGYEEFKRGLVMVLENSEAAVMYSERSGDYYAIEKKRKGNGYGISPYYHNFVIGDFKKCKKYFEKYSKETIEKLRRESK